MSRINSVFIAAALGSVFNGAILFLNYPINQGRLFFGGRGRFSAHRPVANLCWQGSCARHVRSTIISRTNHTTRRRVLPTSHLSQSSTFNYSPLITNTDAAVWVDSGGECVKVHSPTPRTKEDLQLRGRSR